MEASPVLGKCASRHLMIVYKKNCLFYIFHRKTSSLLDVACCNTDYDAMRRPSRAAHFYTLFSFTTYKNGGFIMENHLDFIVIKAEPKFRADSFALARRLKPALFPSP